MGMRRERERERERVGKEKRVSWEGEKREGMSKERWE